MTKQLRKVVYVLWVATILVFTGCKQPQQQQQHDLAYGPDVDKLVVANDYVPKAIEVTGGYQPWIKTVQFERDCVVTFYKPDGTFYLTEQHHIFYPWSNSIRLSGLEPNGKFVWQLSQGCFEVLKQHGHGTDGGVLPVQISPECFAKMVLDITIAPVRLLNASAELVKVSKPLRIGGIWYYPVERVNSQGLGAEDDCDEIVFYQRRDTSLVDLVWLTGGREKFLAVRGYDYRKIEEGGISIPYKIEIFKTDSRDVLQQRVAKIDYY